MVMSKKVCACLMAAMCYCDSWQARSLDGLQNNEGGAEEAEKLVLICDQMGGC